MVKTSAQLRLETLALRQQLAVLRRSAPERLKLTPADRIFWVWLRRLWLDWRSALLIVKPETVIAWHPAAHGPLRSHGTSHGRVDRTPAARSVPWDSAPRYLLRD